MKSVFKYSVAIAASIIALAACNKMEMPAADEALQDGKHSCKMVLNGAVAGYEGTTLRGIDTKGSSSWSDGDLVYIAFSNGSSIVPGTAIYSAADGWSVSFDGDLSEGSSQKCEVRFFVNTTFANENLVTLNPQSEVYEDVHGSFDYANETITVNASLTPKVGRIRFTGNSGDEIHVTGITTFTTFSPATNKFTTSAAMVPLTVAADGYTPYVYGIFTYDDRKISVIGSDFAFTRNCKDSVLLPGDSGYMAIPSKTSHNSWRSGFYVTVNGVDFKMLPVTGLNSGFFLLGETEVTRAQYKAVTGSGSSDQYPCNDISYYYVQSFVTELNDATSLSFYIPTMDEWQYAAKGGELSQGYTYAGSNTPGDVAWYSGNSKNDYNEVKQLAPNELGFYDMSGNVGEWTSSGSSSSHYVCGGAYNDSESKVTITSSYLYSSFDYSVGMRIALKCK